MTLTLLLDLDDTLLENEIQSFLPRYLEVFSQFIAPHLDPQAFVEALLAGTRKMTLNQRPDCTLKEVFEEVFFSKLDINPHEFQGLAAEFYAQVFPVLKDLTRPKPGARDLVETAVERGYRLSVATNPLFPLTAIHQRLAWANLPPEQFPFEQISSYDRYHFTKPDPAYYAEILAYMRWPEGGVVMVGDDLNMDISGARKLGVPAFWLNKDGAKLDIHTENPSMIGSIEDVLPWLDRIPPGELQPDYSSHSALLAILRSTPAVLDGICRNLSAAIWRHSPDEGSWCLTEVVCHLRDVDLEVNLTRLKRVREENNPFLPSEDTDTWAKSRNYLHQDGQLALQQFTIARVKLVEMLGAIDPENWERKVRHAIFGPTDLHELVVIIAGHDRLHVRQMQEILDEISSKKNSN